jgi:hypothetical protein
VAVSSDLKIGGDRFFLNFRNDFPDLSTRMKKPIKLRQAQVWKLGEKFLRIVRLERLEVEYKSTSTLTAEKGTHHTVSKKEFCRLIKPAELLDPEKNRAVTNEADVAASAL